MYGVEHVFNENAISRGGVIDEDVGDSADKLAVLDDRRTRHALHDAARLFDQRGVGHLDRKALGAGGTFVNIGNADAVLAGTRSVQRAKNVRLALLDLGAMRDGERGLLGDGLLRKDAEYTAVGVL